MSVEIIILKNDIPEAMDRLRAKLTVENLAAVVGPACEKLTRRHIARLGKNAKGWPSTHFNEQASDATRWEPHPEGALVRVAKVGMRQRFRGGHISPVTARALTIPISPVSYGHRASEFPGLFRIHTPSGDYLVQHGQEYLPTVKGTRQTWSRRRKDAGGNASKRIKASLNFLFKLSAGVDQVPHPDVIPSHEAMVAAGHAAILSDLRVRR